MLMLHVDIMYTLSAQSMKHNLPALRNIKPDRWRTRHHVSRCMSLLLTWRRSERQLTYWERPRHFVNSSSTVEQFPSMLNRNAFDLKLEATVFSDDNEYYMEAALKCNSACCPPQRCSICQHEPRPHEGARGGKKQSLETLSRLLQD